MLDVHVFTHVHVCICVMPFWNDISGCMWGRPWWWHDGQDDGQEGRQRRMMMARTGTNKLHNPCVQAWLPPASFLGSVRVDSPPNEQVLSRPCWSPACQQPVHHSDAMTTVTVTMIGSRQAWGPQKTNQVATIQCTIGRVGQQHKFVHDIPDQATNTIWSCVFAIVIRTDTNCY
jgi:hypothetical protein